MAQTSGTLPQLSDNIRRKPRGKGKKGLGICILSQLFSVQKRSALTPKGRTGWPVFLARCSAPSFATWRGPRGPSMEKPAGQPRRTSLANSTSAPTAPREEEPRTAP